MERLSNRALSVPDVQTFVAESSAISAPRPPTVDRVVALNRGPFVGAQPPIEQVAATEGQLLDIRSADDFAAGHVPGALNVPVEGSMFGTKAGFVLDHERPITLHASSPEQAQTSAQRLRAVGLLDLAGYVLDAETPGRLDPIDVAELERLLAEDAVEVLDVREKDERDEGYIPGSRHMPYRLVGAFRDELENGRPIVTVCESGARAGIAASVLAAQGVPVRPLLHGGVEEWQERGNRLTAFRRCGGSC
jgi:rhodanese-related sulfurtransferase